MAEAKTFDQLITGVPIEDRYRPHIFFADGEWRLWITQWMSIDVVKRAHDHIRRLSGLLPTSHIQS